jgi:hypothetical protein
MFRRTVLALCAVTALGMTAAGAACVPTADDAESSNSDLTVASGARFVVSANPDEVIVHKQVDGTPFPFDADSLKGKAIIIHPVLGKSNDGVYSRVNRVRDDGDDYVLAATPLTFTEMATITEDEIVRIYLDPRMEAAATRAAQLGARVDTGGVVEAGSVVDDLLAPQSSPFGAVMRVNGLPGVSGLPFGVFGSDRALDIAGQTFPGVQFDQTVSQASFRPNVLFSWSKETGLELGFRTAMDWKSTATFNVSVSGQFFRSNAYEAFGAWVFTPVGPVVIPIKAGVRLRVLCTAQLVGPIAATLNVEAHVQMGGSLRIKPSKDTSPTDWVTEGSWPREATGSASVTSPTFETDALDGTIWCSLPRVELHTEIFGAVGPVAVVAPTAVLDATAGFHSELRFSAGIAGSLFGWGAGYGIEVPVYTLRF